MTSLLSVCWACVGMMYKLTFLMEWGEWWRRSSREETWFLRNATFSRYEKVREFLTIIIPSFQTLRFQEKTTCLRLVLTMIGGFKRVRGGEKVIIRAREREKKEKPICSSRLSRSCLTLALAYKSCFACRTLISNWIDRCFGQHSWNSVHSLSRDNLRIPTNPLSGSQRPPLLWGQWIRIKPCSKLTRPLQPWLIQTEVTSQLHRTWRGFCWRYNSVPLIRRLSVTHIYMLVCNAYIWAFW